MPVDKAHLLRQHRAGMTTGDDSLVALDQEVFGRVNAPDPCAPKW
jgi:hypothetical protein